MQIADIGLSYDRIFVCQTEPLGRFKSILAETWCVILVSVAGIFQSESLRFFVPLWLVKNKYHSTGNLKLRGADNSEGDCLPSLEKSCDFPPYFIEKGRHRLWIIPGNHCNCCNRNLIRIPAPTVSFHLGLRQVHLQLSL